MVKVTECPAYNVGLFLVELPEYDEFVKEGLDTGEEL